MNNSGNMKGAKETVLKAYPDAWATPESAKLFGDFWIWHDQNPVDDAYIPLGKGRTAEAAWQDAASHLPAAPPEEAGITSFPYSVASLPQVAANKAEAGGPPCADCGMISGHTIVCPEYTDRHDGGIESCDKAPEGWACSREIGHGGPCAARPLLLRSSAYVEAVELAGKLGSDDAEIYAEALGELRDLIHARTPEPIDQEMLETLKLVRPWIANPECWANSVKTGVQPTNLLEQIDAVLAKAPGRALLTRSQGHR